MLESDIDRRRLLQAGVGGAAALLAGCSGDGGGGSGTDELHILTDYNSEAWQSRWEDDIVPKYEGETDIDVTVEYAGRTDALEQRLATLIQSGDPPNGYQTATGQSMQFILDGQVGTVTDLVEEWKSQYGELTGEEIIRFGGDHYLVPHGLYLYGSFQYRQDIYEDLGLDVPETWDDVLQNSQAIAESDRDIVPYAVSGVQGRRSQYEFRQHLNCSGATLFQWTDGPGSEVELAFPESNVIEVLEYMEDLAEYSTDPSNNTYNQVLNDYASGRVAQIQMINVYGPGIAATAGADSIARNSEIAITPINGSADPVVRGFSEIDGAVVWDVDGQEEMKDFYRMMYENESEYARNHVETEPTRFFPPFREVTQTDAYRNADVMSQYDGHLFDLIQEFYDDIAPALRSEERPITAPTEYTWGAKPSPLSQMLNDVLVAGVSKTEAYQTARQDLEETLAEGKEMASDF